MITVRYGKQTSCIYFSGMGQVSVERAKNTVPDVRNKSKYCMESVHFATASRPLQTLFDCRKFVTMSADIKFVHNTYRSTECRAVSLRSLRLV